MSQNGSEILAAVKYKGQSPAVLCSHSKFSGEAVQHRLHEQEAKMSTCILFLHIFEPHHLTLILDTGIQHCYIVSKVEKRKSIIGLLCLHVFLLHILTSHTLN